MKRSYLTQKDQSDDYELIEVRHSLRPSYYDDFKCIAQDCETTCCGGWDITMDRKNYLSLRKQHGSEELNEIIKQSVHKIKNSQENEYAEIRCSKNGLCPMMTKDRLCGLQVECGYQALPTVCKVFPRSEQCMPSGYLEKFLSVGCEEVLELLWNLPNGIDFIERPLPKTEWKALQFEKVSLYVYFGEIRLLCMDLLQDRRFSVSQRILLMGIFLQKISEEAKEVPSWFVESRAFLEMPNVVEMVENLLPTAAEVSQKAILQSLKTITEILITSTDLATNQKEFIYRLLNGNEAVKKENICFTVNLEEYKQAKQNLFNTFGDLEYFFENLSVSLFYSNSLPDLSSKEDLWKSYVNFCNIYSILRFTAVMSCREIIPNQKQMLFKALTLISRSILHNTQRQKNLRDSFFKNESSSLAHMAILLSQ